MQIAGCRIPRELVREHCTRRSVYFARTMNDGRGAAKGGVTRVIGEATENCTIAHRARRIQRPSTSQTSTFSLLANAHASTGVDREASSVSSGRTDLLVEVTGESRARESGKGEKGLCRLRSSLSLSLSLSLSAPKVNEPLERRDAESTEVQTRRIIYR